jgi:hypothetical protein
MSSGFTAKCIMTPTASSSTTSTRGDDDPTMVTNTSTTTVGVADEETMLDCSFMTSHAIEEGA